jgi:CheY-like chemotaxis protein
MRPTIKILHLEDNKSDSQLVKSILERANVVFDYFFADNEHDYLFYLENQKIDIILSDYHLPDYSGSEALQVAKSKYPHIPFVFVSGTMGEEVAVESLLHGATAYVLKNRLER